MVESQQHCQRTLKTVLLVLAIFAGLSIAVPAAARGYKQTNLVSDGAVPAVVIDPNLKNPWGIALSPTSPFWIADNATGLSTLYNGAGAIVPLVVTIPPPMGSTATAAPTGIVFNGTSDFEVTGAGGTGAAFFIFATEDGTISGWNPTADRTHAILGADRSPQGAVYKGLATLQNFFGNFLCATNFHSGMIDVFDDEYDYVGSFTDPKIPHNYAPFGIQNINGWLYVTYAKKANPDSKDDVPGVGHGFVDVFDNFGFLVRRLVSHDRLNSPWGLALAPAHFGKFSNALLVGNFGDGRIHAYSPHKGHFLGTLRNPDNEPIINDGLWALKFGNGGNGGKTDVLYFTAGLNDEADGLFGSLEVAPNGPDSDGDNDGD